jgi:EAL domain-containing protein (putative c-di-GMP-specific phosphodiesterase class I)/AmiR/NasT family two-component response regulator
LATAPLKDDRTRPRDCPRPRLLVIDDDGGVRQIVESLGRAAGFEAYGCEGEQSLDAQLLEHYDVIILDLVMPVVDGVEVIERLAQEGCTARLILVSGQDRRVLASASRLATACGLEVAATFAKPFSGAALRSCLAEQRDVIAAGSTTLSRSARPEIDVSQVERALREREFVMHYQPQVRVDTLEWVGVEALARWQHPELGLLYPDVFVPLIERDPDLMRRFSQHVMRVSCGEVAAAAGAGVFQGRLAMNVAADVLAAAEFLDLLVATAAAAGLANDHVVLEVTETSLPADSVKALAIQTRLRMRGVSLAVDDFGTGHSSLERLHTFPMDELKIDQHFVRESTTDPEARAIVTNSIMLARDLEVRCVAEGVETVEALRLLAELKCSCAQGYFIGRPMPARDLGNWAAEWQSRRASILAALE